MGQQSDDHGSMQREKVWWPASKWHAESTCDKTANLVPIFLKIA